MADASGGIPPRMPRRPVVGSIASALRPFRHRLRQTIDSIDRGRQGSQRDTARTLVTIIDGGHIPTQADKVFLGQITEIDCEDSEGAVPTFTPDASQTIPVIFIRNAPAAGDYAVAHAIAGRWVAEVGGGNKICVKNCANLPVPLVLVEVLDADGNVIASCTTGDDGCCKIGVSGTRRVRVSGVHGVLYDGNRDLSGTTTISLPSGRATICCGPCILPETLYVTDSHGTVALIWDFILQRWRGCYTMQVNGITSCQCFNGDPTEGPVTILIKYEIELTNTTNQCFLQVSRTWPACSIPGGGVHYCAGEIGFDPELSECPDGSIDVGEDCDGSGYPVTCAVSDASGLDSVAIPMDADHCLPQSATMTLTVSGDLTSPLGADITVQA